MHSQYDTTPSSPVDFNFDHPLISVDDQPSKQHNNINNNKKDRINTTDELYDALGNPGLFSKVVFIVVSFNMLTVASNHAAGVFLDYSPDHVCNALSINNTNVQNENNNSDRIIISECSTTLYSSHGLNSTRKCLRGEWVYSIDERESSSVTEWDLVCERSSMAHLSSTLYFAGVMLGGLLFGPLSDLVGRRWTILLALYLSVALGFGISFTENLIVYIVLRALMGIAIQGFLTATYIRLLELFGPQYRGFAGNALYFVWGVALNYLGLMAWLFKDWRLIQIACIAQGIIGMFYIWLIPESLRWLLARGKAKKATVILNRIYRLNGCSDERCLDPTLVNRLMSGKESSSGGKSTTSILDLARNPILRRRTFILGYITLAVNFGYWGLTYNTQTLVGNRYQNFILSTIPEIFVYLFNIFLLNRFGRKRPMMFYFGVSSVCCLTSAFLVIGGKAAMGTEVMVVTTIGRLAACGLMGANDVFMAELYPTVLRNTGVGVCVCVGRLGALITPVLFSLSEFTFPGLPLVSFGIVTFIALFLTMLLPDTWGQQLPDTIQDLEMTIVVTAPENGSLITEKPEINGHVVSS